MKLHLESELLDMLDEAVQDYLEWAKTRRGQQRLATLPSQDFSQHAKCYQALRYGIMAGNELQLDLYERTTDELNALAAAFRAWDSQFPQLDPETEDYRYAGYRDDIGEAIELGVEGRAMWVLANTGRELASDDR